jgi:hypothetical protein
VPVERCCSPPQEAAARVEQPVVKSTCEIDGGHWGAVGFLAAHLDLDIPGSCNIAGQEHGDSRLVGHDPLAGNFATTDGALFAVASFRLVRSLAVTNSPGICSVVLPGAYGRWRRSRTCAPLCGR